MTMAMERHGRLMLAVLHETAPTNDEWQCWLDHSATRIGKDLRAMIEVFGHVGPNAKQRQAMTPMLGRLDPRTAVLSDSRVVRGLVTVVSWLGIPNAAFGAGEHATASRYLELTPEECALATAVLKRLRHAAGVNGLDGPGQARRSASGR